MPNSIALLDSTISQSTNELIQNPFPSNFSFPALYSHFQYLLHQSLLQSTTLSYTPVETVFFAISLCTSPYLINPYLARLTEVGFESLFSAPDAVYRMKFDRIGP